MNRPVVNSSSSSSRHGRYRSGVSWLPPPPMKAVTGIQFGLATPEWVRAMSTVPVKHSSTTERLHNKFGVNDIVMGACDRGSRCIECHTTMNDCVGHPGDIDMWMYIPSPFTVDILKRVVECVCMCCGMPLFPHTNPKVREELLSLPAKKRLDAAKKKCLKVMYCGQLQRHIPAPETSSNPGCSASAMEDVDEKGEPSCKASSSTDDGGFEVEAEEGGDDDEAASDSSSDSEKEDEKEDEKEEDKEEDPAALSSESEDSGESGSEDEQDSASESDTDEGGSGSDSDGAGSQRRKSRKKSSTKKTTPSKTPSSASTTTTTTAVTDAATKAMMMPRRRSNRPKQYSSNFDYHAFRQHGCGAPVARYTRDGLRLKATFILPFENNLSKKKWPIHNSWRIYEVLRSMPDDIQELLGFNTKHAPIRALLMRYLHVPPPIVRRKKEDNSKTGNQDDNTQALKEVVMRSRKLLQRLKDEAITTHAQLGSLNRCIQWYCSPKSKRCTCVPAGLAGKFRCTCAASGRIITCDEKLCTDPDWCTCVPREYLPTNLQLTAKLKTLYDARDKTSKPHLQQQQQQQQQQAPPPPQAGAMGPPAAIPIGTIKRSAKGWRDLALDLENALTTYLIGDINKKGAGRKDGKPGLAPWAATNNASNSLVKRDRSFAARFVGKHGRIRGTMYGKRCDKTARTVASGDIYQNVGEIGVPREIAETLTVCELFQPYNRSRMIDRLRSNKVDYVMMENGDLYNTRFLNRDFYVMPYGSTCERHIESGDPVVWNRQPTLHKPSIEGAEALLLNHPFNSKRRRTIAINQCLTTATNADFDGDELNLHLAKSQDARAETSTLMSAPQQIRSQQGDSVIIVLVQNARLALHLMTDPKTCFRRDEFQQLLFQFGQVSKKRRIQLLFERALYQLPSPKAVDANNSEPLWTGLQVISALLPPGICYGNGENPGGQAAYIVNSEMLWGRLSGKDVGHGESGNLIHAMVQDVGEEVTVAWLSGFQRVLNYFLMQYGATMNPADYEMRPTHRVESLELTEKARAWCHVNAASTEGGYDMRRTNKQERKIIDVLNRSRDLVASRLTLDVEHRVKYGTGYRRNGVLDLINSGAKGKHPNLIQMGAMVGQQMPLRGRVVANVAHFNVTLHMPEAHGYVPECYRDGLSPWGYFCAAIGGREGLVHTGSSTPQVGYFQKRLGTNMSDLHAKSDGSIRDCRDQIVQWSYGDDGKDPSFLESNEAKFLTPVEHASPELKLLQKRLLQSRAQLYDTANFLPKKFLAPLNFERTFRRSQSYKQGQPITVGEVERLCGIWYREMVKENLLRENHDPRYNLLLDAMLQDALSPWHTTVKWQLTLSQMEFILREIERALARSSLVSGEAVGPIASQAMGEPATQSTLNLFHFAGSQNTTQSLISRLNDTANACKKPAAAGMQIFVHEDWAKRIDLVQMIARDVPERRLMEFVIDIQLHLPTQPWLPEDQSWLPASLELQPTKSLHWFNTLPSVRVEFNLLKCKRLHLHLMEIATTIQTFFKRGVAVISSGSYSDRWFVYVALDHEHIARLAAAPNSQNFTPAEKINTMMTLTESAVIACLQESCIRGLARVTDSMVVELETRAYSEAEHTIKARKEWAIVTQGSNFDALLTLPAVDFERCATTYIHDVHKLLGIEGARRWLDENLEDLVRNSRVDGHHTKLIADVMTRTGAVTPMTRNGLQNSTDSVCRLLFEDVLENIKKAGVYAQHDPLKGVPESILMGIPAAIGTGAVSLIETPANTSQDPQPAATTRPFKVVFGMRKVPCRSRPFRFFQMFVPVGRNCKLDHLSESKGPITTSSLSHLLTSTIAAATAPAVQQRSAAGMFNYVRIQRWPAATSNAPPSQQPTLTTLAPSQTMMASPALEMQRMMLWDDWVKRAAALVPREFDFWQVTQSWLNTHSNTITITHINDINNSEALVSFTPHP